jgi:hypothetical protein
MLGKEANTSCPALNGNKMKHVMYLPIKCVGEIATFPSFEPHKVS